MPNQITIYHSSDTDDLFMMYGFEKGVIETPGIIVKRVPGDIDNLNHRARAGELDVTAASVHAYAYLADNYVISSTGASFGGPEHGPKLVAKPSFTFGTSKVRIGIPGELTSAALALRLYLAMERIDAEISAHFFEDLPQLVQSGTIDMGLLIHEGQLTHVHNGLKTFVDLGRWWWKKHSEPLPLGIVIVHRRLGDAVITQLVDAMRASIEYGLANRKEAIEYAMSFGRGMTFDEADKYIDMYVNEITVDFGDVGKRSIERFLSSGVEYGVLKAMPDVSVR